MPPSDEGGAEERGEGRDKTMTFSPSVAIVTAPSSEGATIKGMTVAIPCSIYIIP